MLRHLRLRETTVVRELEHAPLLGGRSPSACWTRRRRARSATCSSLAEVDGWDDLSPDGKAEPAVDLIARQSERYAL